MRRVTCPVILLIVLCSAAWAQNSPAPPGAEVFREVVYGKSGSRELHVDVVVPKEPAAKKPCVVWIHGGGWRAGTYKQNRAMALASHGYVVASVEYRLSQEAIFPAQIHDCKAAIRYLRANAARYSIDADHIGAWGASAGGHLVALLGTSGGVKELEGEVGSPGISSRVQAVCDFFGPADFTVIPPDIGESSLNPVALLLGDDPREKTELARLASPIKHVTKDDAPILIVHGEVDKLVNISQSEGFYKALKNAGVDATLVRVKNAGHGFAPSGDIQPGFDEIEKRVREFFDEHLKPK